MRFAPETYREYIPDKMKNAERWILWKIVNRNNHETKVPFQVKAPTLGAKSNDPNTWASFDDAINALDKYSSEFDGIGFMLGDGWCGLDIDHIEDDLEDWGHGSRDPQNKVNLSINLLDSTYIELSQSGAGIHAIFNGVLPENANNHKNGFELYSEGRFFALTANLLQPCEGLTSLVDPKKIDNLVKSTVGYKTTNADSKIAYSSNDLSAADIINQIKSQTGLTNDLFNGIFEPKYNSQSEADFGFCKDLAKLTNCDPDKIDIVFRQSGLMRNKWDKQHGATTYGKWTINRAIAEVNKEQTQYNYAPDMLEGSNTLDRHYSMDDMGNAQRFLKLFPHKFKYSYTDKQFYFYDGSYWNLDDMGYIDQYADKVPEAMKNEPIVIPEDVDEEKVKKQWHKFISSSRNHTSKVHMKEELKHHIAVKHGEFDPDDMLLNTKTGYIDLANGNLYDHDYRKMFSKQANVEYDPKATASLWNKFLKQIFNDDQELIHYVQKCAGYSFTGANVEQNMFLLLGDGSNGKSVLMNTLNNVAGSYAKELKPESIIKTRFSNGSAPNSDIARLEGARLVTSSEINQGVNFDEALIKQLTGGEKIVARYLFGSEFEYVPKFKIWMSVNELPTIQGTDNGIWRRIKVIPFNVQITKDQVDPYLEKKLQKEFSGILNWILEGALMWQKEGLNEPQAVENATVQYRAEMNPIIMFISECCELDSNSETKASILWNKYNDWAKSSNEPIGTQRNFGKKLHEQLNRVRRTDGNYYLGIKLKESYKMESC